METKGGKLELIAHKSFAANDELIKVVDFLNKNLKVKQIMFGITKDKEKNQMTINVYEF
ncbi:MAG: YpmA family protein [Syntrophomonadaceae bacterium]|nr:YpmA family protein [Syntrophomonadaceae bacterium]